MNSWRKWVPLAILNLLAVVPLLWLIFDYFNGRLTADPIRDIQLRTGFYAIVLLVVGLTGTPLYRLLGFSWLRSLRRLAGLYAFGYAGLHLLNFLWLDYGWNFTFLREDLLEKRYAVAGLIAFILLLPLALTSTAGWQRRLGKRWRVIHWLVYPAIVIAAVHFIWQAKIDIRLPVIFTIVIAVLLFLRLPPVVTFLKRLRIFRRSASDSEA